MINPIFISFGFFFDKCNKSILSTLVLLKKVNMISMNQNNTEKQNNNKLKYPAHVRSVKN